MPVSIDVGSRYMKILKGDYTKKGTIAITNCIIEETPEGVIENGYIKDMTALSMALRNIATKNKLSKNICNVTVKSSDIAAREFVVPIVSKGKLKKVVGNEIASIFGSVNEYYIDWFIVEPTVVEYKNVYRVMAYAVPKQIVIGYFELINQISLKPQAFDVHRNSISKLCRGNVLINDESVIDKNMILIDIGASYMELDLIMEGKSIFKRSIPIAEELDAENDSGVGYYGSYEDVSDGDEYNSYLSSEMGSNEYLYGGMMGMSSIPPIFQKINEEAYKMMQFAVSREGGQSVTNIFLYGGNSVIEGLDEHLSASLEVQVDIVESISNIETPLELSIKDIMPAAGSIIRR